MRKQKKNVEIHQIQVLRLQLGEVIRQHQIIKAALLNLEKELIRLAELLRQGATQSNGVST